MNKKIVLLAIVIAGLIFGGRYTYAQGTNCDNPKLASDDCVVEFGDPSVKAGVISMLSEYGVIDEKYTDNPDLDLEITVGQMKSTPPNAHLNIISSDEDRNRYIEKALNGESISLKGLEYISELAGFYSQYKFIQDFSVISHIKIRLSSWLDDRNIAVLRDVRLNSNGVFKNPIIGLNGKPLPFGNLKNPEKQLQELAKNGLDPILVQDVNEKGEPDREGGYLKLLSNPYILSYEKAIETTYVDGHEQLYGNIESLTYENNISLLGVSIAKEEVQSAENRQDSKLENGKVEAPNTGVLSQDNLIWLMGSIMSLIIASYLTKRC